MSPGTASLGDDPAKADCCRRGATTLYHPCAGGSQFILQGIPCLVACLQVTPDKRSNILARILIKTVVTNLLLDIVLQRSTDFDVNATSRHGLFLSLSSNTESTENIVDIHHSVPATRAPLRYDTSVTAIDAFLLPSPCRPHGIIGAAGKARGCYPYKVSPTAPETLPLLQRIIVLPGIKSLYR